MDDSDAVSVTDCTVVYVPVDGDTEIVGRVVSMVYSDVEILPELFAVSFAKYFRVEFVLIEIKEE